MPTTDIPTRRPNSRRRRSRQDCPLDPALPHQSIRAARAGCTCPEALAALAVDDEKHRARVRNRETRARDDRKRSATDRIPPPHVPAPRAAPSPAPAIRSASDAERAVTHGNDHACRDEDPELFFPVPTRGPAHQAQVAAAKDVCHRCPVLAACLQGVLARGEEFGVWAATTPDERKAIRRGRVADSAAA